MPRKTVTKRADTAKARYGKTMKGTGGKAKPSAKVKPKGNPLSGVYGFKYKAKF